jgi:hypothetical protein
MPVCLGSSLLVAQGCLSDLVSSGSQPPSADQLPVSHAFPCRGSSASQFSKSKRALLEQDTDSQKTASSGPPRFVKLPPITVTFDPILTAPSFASGGHDQVNPWGIPALMWGISQCPIPACSKGLQSAAIVTALSQCDTT